MPFPRRQPRRSRDADRRRRRLTLELLERRLLLAGDWDLLKDINAVGASGSQPTGVVEAGGYLYFAAPQGGGTELWKSDGTDPGTVRVKDVFAGIQSSSPSSLTNVAGTLFFTANDGVSGAELWKSDGTEAGTVRVKDIFSGPTGSAPQQLVNVGGTLFFNANDGTTGFELWKSDGTEAGTVRVKDIRSGPNGSLSTTANQIPFTNLNGTLLFFANDGASGLELWKSDGTTAGTVRVKDINAGSAGSGTQLSPPQVANIGGTLYFSARDSSTGYELWKSDGTEAGTVLVKNIRTGAAHSYPRNFTEVGGTIFFAAIDATTGIEL